MSNIFPTDYSTKTTPDGTDVVWSSDAVTNFNLTISSIALYTLTNATTDDLDEWSVNKYYSDALVDANTTVVSKQDKSNLSTDINTDTWSDVKYPSVKAVEDYVGNFSIPDATTTVKGKVELATDTEAQNSNWTWVIQANQLNKLSEDVIVQTITSDTSTTFNVTLNHSLGRIPLRIDYTWIKPDDSFYSKWHFNWNGSTLTSQGYVYWDLSTQWKWTDGFWYIYGSSWDYYRIEIWGAITSTQVVLTLTEIWTSTWWMDTECIFVLS